MKSQIPLVLVTGLLSDRSVFKHQITKLKDLADISVVELTDVGSPTAMVEKILRLSPDRFALAGHSIGGWVVLKLMKIAPEKVIKLCVLNTSARGILPDEITARQEVLTRVQQGDFQQVAKEIADKFTFNESVKEEVRRMFLHVGEQALIHQTQAMMLRENLLPVLPKIACPTLIIHAREDRRFSLEVHEELCNLIPHAKLAIIDDCGHMSPMESPAAVTEHLRYWLSNFIC